MTGIGTKLDLIDRDEFIFERYVEADIGYLHMLRRAAANEKRLDREVKRYEKRRRSHPHFVEGGRRLVMSSHGGPPSHWFRVGLPIVDMLKSGFVVRGEEGWQVDAHVKQTLREFSRFLEIKRATVDWQPPLEDTGAK